MLHFGFLNIRTDIFILIISVVLLCIQLLLCFKTKKKWIRFLPSALFLTAAVALSFIGLFFEDWNQFGFLFLAGCSAVLFFVCVIGFGIRKIIQNFQRKNKNR